MKNLLKNGGNFGNKRGNLRRFTMEEDLKKILKYRSWQISDAYERIDNADKYKLGKEDVNIYYEAIMDFMFFAYEDIIKLDEKNS